MSETEVVIEFGYDRLDPTQRAVRSAAFLQLLETGQPASIVTVSPGRATDAALAERFTCLHRIDAESQKRGAARCIGKVGRPEHLRRGVRG